MSSVINTIFDELCVNISKANCPEDIVSHIEKAKRNVKSYMDKKNMDIFADIIDKMTPIEHCEDQENNSS